MLNKSNFCPRPGADHASQTLHNYEGQVTEALAIVRALNKMTKAGMPKSGRIA
ncbi:transposase [Serratia symbiotica]|uniref:Transposase n=1 Tax=Serratia symbiotica TaxID=138074 RepID=A0A455VK72_9GAMM|nr:transposase [Serratia symbiotica]